MNQAMSAWPFGNKYKDQPVELVLQDRQYCDWVASQPWFREKYTVLYQTIINYSGAPQG